MGKYDNLEWLTVEQVADLFQVNEETVRRWIRAGTIPVLDLQSRKSGYRLRIEDVQAFIDSNYHPVEKKPRR